MIFFKQLIKQPLSNNIGFSLIEVLTAIGLATFATLVSQALFQMSIRNFNVQNKVTVMMDEQQLYEILTKTIGEVNSCKGNLAPNATAKPPNRPSTGYVGYYGQHHLKGVGGLHEVHLFDTTTGLKRSTAPLVSIGPFMQYLNIVKMDLVSPGNPDPAQNGFPTAENTEVHRKFTVYYKYKQGLVKIDSNAGASCTSADTSGCYRLYCELSKYKITGTTVNECEATCTRPNWGGGGSVDCYKVDETGKTFVGCDSAKEVAGKDTTGTGNAFFGYEAGNANTTGSNNTLIGYETGKENTKGIYNVFIGYKTGKNSKEVTAYDDPNHGDYYKKQTSKNTYIGSYAGEQNTIGRNHVFIGYRAGQGIKQATQSAIGGQSNTFIGSDSGKANRGDENVFIGAQTGLQSAPSSKKTATSNVFVGAYAGSHNTDGDNNVFIGRDAGQKNTRASSNVFIGKSAGKGNTTGGHNIFIGAETGQGDTSTTPDTPVTGSNNVAIGYQAGNKLTTATGSTFIGAYAGKLVKEGLDDKGLHNTFIGYKAGENNTGSYNNFVGASAGAKNEDGTRNAFFGDNAGANQVTCNNTEVPWAGGNKYCQNTFFGHYAGNKTNGGFRNVYFGAGTGRDATTAKENTFMGANAGKHTTGSGNTFFGSGAGHGSSEETKTTTAITTGSNNIFIGKEAGLAGKGGVSKTGDYQLNIGNLIFGKMPSSAPTGAEKNFFTRTSGNKYLNKEYDTGKKQGVVINGDLYVQGTIHKKCKDGPCQVTLTSSKVYKKNITPFLDFNKALTDITTTQLFTYEYTKDHPEHKRMGIIAEDLPPHLQIKDQYEPVKPDWVSIYGTFWASIKALFNKVTNLTKSILKLNSITSSLKVNLYEVKEKLEDLHGVKDRLEVLEKETQFLRKQNKELKKKIKSQDKKIKTLNKKVGVSQ